MIIGLTQAAKTDFQKWLDANTNDRYGSFDAIDRFDVIANFHADNSAHYEHSKAFTKTGNPEIYFFDAEDFEYE